VRGIVKIDDGTAVHVIPRAEVRHVEVVALKQRGPEKLIDEALWGGWVLRYQLVGADPRSVEWCGDCRPPTLRNDAKISIAEYNRIAAEAVQATITRGHRDVHLERRSDGVILVRAGLIENDEHVVMCRKFIAETVLAALASPHGRLDETHGKLLREIYAAARDLVLPAGYPIQEERR
jgi:hypothetical protein